MRRVISSKKKVAVIAILTAAVVGMSCLAWTVVSHRRTARKYEHGYPQIKVGDSKDLVVT